MQGEGWKGELEEPRRKGAQHQLIWSAIADAQGRADHPLTILPGEGSTQETMETPLPTLAVFCLSKDTQPRNYHSRRMGSHRVDTPIPSTQNRSLKDDFKCAVSEALTDSEGVG